MLSEESDRSMIIDRLLDPLAAPGHVVPTIDAMTEEALTLVSAGYDSTATAMILGLFYICRHREVYDRLESEIDGSFPQGGCISLKKLRTLPYLVRKPISVSKLDKSITLMIRQRMQ